MNFKNVASNDTVAGRAQNRRVEVVIDWTNDDAQGLYSYEDIQAHLTELETLKSDVKNKAVDVMEPDWFESLLGFTCSVKNTQS